VEAFLLSTGLVALAEMGDKTQLLALVLVARFRKPGPIVLGILVATILNHAIAGGIGHRLGSDFTPGVLRWLLGLSFLAMSAWALVPDKLDAEDTRAVDRFGGWGVFGATTLAFFVAEMGDKTQFATIALAAQFEAYVPVVAGTTLGMLLANAPVVWLGDALCRRIPLRTVRVATACLFFALGVTALLWR
jgi:putative Ca2+/H+ antiporter (TMEM165/GDT1 family)